MKNMSYLFTTQILFMWKFLFLRYIYKKGNVKVFQSFNLRCFLSYWCAPLSLPIKLQSSSKGNIKRSIVYIILIFCTHLVSEEALKCYNGLNYLALSINEIAEFFKSFALSNTPQQATKRCKDVFFYSWYVTSPQPKIYIFISISISISIHPYIYIYIYR